jgi:hypothetical protein
VSFQQRLYRLALTFPYSGQFLSTDTCNRSCRKSILLASLVEVVRAYKVIHRSRPSVLVVPIGRFHRKRNTAVTGSGVAPCQTEATFFNLLFIRVMLTNRHTFGRIRIFASTSYSSIQPIAYHNNHGYSYQAQQ